MSTTKGHLPTELKGDDLANREYYVDTTQFKAQLKKEVQTGYKLGTGYVKAGKAG